jgi:hypothetical protein
LKNQATAAGDGNIAASDFTAAAVALASTTLCRDDYPSS